MSAWMWKSEMIGVTKALTDIPPRHGDVKLVTKSKGRTGKRMGREVRGLRGLLGSGVMTLRHTTED